MKRKKGSLTVEATIILPVYILFLTFLATFLNVFYMHLVIQQGLHAIASTVAQYCYAVDLTLGMDLITLSEETSEKAQQLSEDIDTFFESAASTMEVMETSLTLESLATIAERGGDLVDATEALVDTASGVTGDDVTNFLLSAGVEAGGGFLVKVYMDDYLEQMKVNQALLGDGVKYGVSISTDGNHDLIFTAQYCYQNAMLSTFIDGFEMKQQVVLHPWIGGEHERLRGGG